MKMSDFLLAISVTGNILVNKRLAFSIGLENAVMFQALLTVKQERIDMGEMDTDGEWFEASGTELCALTTLKAKRREQALTALVELGYIQMQFDEYDVAEYKICMYDTKGSKK